MFYSLKNNLSLQTVFEWESVSKRCLKDEEENFISLTTLLVYFQYYHTLAPETRERESERHT